MSSRGRVLVVDDEPGILRAIRRLLESVQYDVAVASDAEQALHLVETETFDAIVTDLVMPGFDGLALLERVHARDRDLPVVILTAQPRLETAIRAMEQSAFRYLTKPFDDTRLLDTVEQAVHLRRLSLVEREAMRLLRAQAEQRHDLAELDGCLDRALESLWIAFQPIVSLSGRRIIGYEALLRSSEPALPNPPAVLEAAEKLDRLDRVGRAVRAAIATRLPGLPEDATVFMNVHPLDLLDEEFLSPRAPLTSLAGRVVVEITERASLESVHDARARIATARQLGFRIAIDDLGAGYSGLNAFAQLEPEVVKLDMLLVRGLDRASTKRSLVRSVLAVAAELGVQVVAEGVETREERDALLALGCDLMQGYFFAPPAQRPPTVHFAD